MAYTASIARKLKQPLVRMIGHGEALKGPRGGKDLDLTHSAGLWSGPRAFEEAGVVFIEGDGGGPGVRLLKA